MCDLALLLLLLYEKCSFGNLLNSFCVPQKLSKEVTPMRWVDDKESLVNLLQKKYDFIFSFSANMSEGFKIKFHLNLMRNER